MSDAEFYFLALLQNKTFYIDRLVNKMIEFFNQEKSSTSFVTREKKFEPAPMRGNEIFGMRQ